MRKPGNTLLEVLVALFIMAILLLSLLPAVGNMAQWGKKIDERAELCASVDGLLAGTAGTGTLPDGSRWQTDCRPFSAVEGVDVVTVTIKREHEQVQYMTLRKASS